MSANNVIYIQEKEKRGERYFVVTMKDADTGSSLGSSELFLDLRNAIESANRIQDAEEVEYGLQIDLLPESYLPKGDFKKINKKKFIALAKKIQKHENNI